VYQAILENFSDNIDHELKIPEIQPPIYDRLDAKKTNWRTMHPVMVNESTTQGNLTIIENILLEQFGFTRDDPHFQTILTFFLGDWKTIERLNSCKSIGKEIATLTFDRLHHILPLPGLWHLKFNMLQMIHSIHMGLYSKDVTSLQYACDAWDRTDAASGKKFRPLENLIIQAYGARVVALVWREARHAKAANSDSTILKTEAIITWLNSMNESSFHKHLERIVDSIHVPIGQIQPPETTRDEKWANNYRFCVHAESYLLLRYAIKQADMRLLLIALKDFAIMSQAPEAHKSKYSIELLQSIHLMDGPAADPKLQRAALANCLVNLRGLSNSWFPTDLLQELVNNTMRTQQRERTSSTLPVKDLIGQCSLNSQSMQRLKQRVEEAFSRSNDDSHPYKSDPDAVRQLSQVLLPTMTRREDHKPPRFTEHVAPDLLISGSKTLRAKLTAYNKRAAMGAKDTDESASTASSRGNFSAEFNGILDSDTAGIRIEEPAEAGLSDEMPESPTLALYDMDMDTVT
jgi:hypothetical protein